MNSNKKGFTLIELLVVIAIIAILSSVVLASLNSARAKARDAKRVSDIKQLQLALEMYYDANGAYPASFTALESALVPTYIATLPVDPTNAGTYVYSYTGLDSSGVCSGYHLGALLENTTNAALNSDVDAAPVTTGLCTGGTDLNGADPMYDVKP